MKWWHLLLIYLWMNYVIFSLMRELYVFLSIPLATTIVLVIGRNRIEKSLRRLLIRRRGFKGLILNPASWILFIIIQLLNTPILILGSNILVMSNYLVAGVLLSSSIISEIISSINKKLSIIASTSSITTLPTASQIACSIACTQSGLLTVLDDFIPLLGIASFLSFISIIILIVQVIISAYFIYSLARGRSILKWWAS